MTLKSFVGQLALACSALAAIVVTSSTVRPVYAARTPVAQRIAAAAWRGAPARADSARDARAAADERAPWAVASADSALRTARFQADREAFAADLVNTGRISPRRADSLATFAVREAYTKKVPPALVFGVLLTENADFRSTSRSNVGAVGLMQIHAPVWVPTLGKLLGRNLRNDETNLRYGVHILAHYVYRVVGKSSDAGRRDTDGMLRTALLRYNGCVRGANTRNCFRYPDKVRQNVEQYALTQCGPEGYEGCVEAPMQRKLEVDGRAEDALYATLARSEATTRQ